MSHLESLKFKPSKPLKLAFTYDRQAEWIEQGFSMDECLEFQDDKTIEAIASALRELGTVEMVGGAKSLTKRLAASKHDWDLVFNFCEGYGTVGREAQVPAILEAHGIPFTFSDSAAMALCQDKAKAKMVCEHFKIPTSYFATIPPRVQWPDSGYNPMSALDASVHAEALRSFPLFVKPATISTGIGIEQTNKVKNQEELIKAIDGLSIKYPRHSILVEGFLSGREFTVGIVGTGLTAQVVGVREQVYVADGGPRPNMPVEIKEGDAYYSLEVYGAGCKFSNGDNSRLNPWQKDIDLKDPSVQGIAKVALDAWKALGCRDAGRVDIRNNTKDPLSAVPNFIEVNPLSGMTPFYSDFPQLLEFYGMTFEELVAMIVGQALRRYDHDRVQGL